jgi:NADH:ubiquinone oxidoreductase subunit 4 (subunit M)
MALAVPLSSNFAGEFLVLAGVFQAGWGYAVVGAVAIVLAAMYMLRLISAVLHRDVGPAVSDAALDLRSAELAILGPLVGILLFLSAWPAAVSGHTFAGGPERLGETLTPPVGFVDLQAGLPPQLSSAAGWRCTPPEC